MIARFIGGWLDGTEQDVMGAEAVHPIIDDQYNADYAAWFAQYGIARAWRWAGGEPDDDIPPPPPMPSEHYRWERDGDDFVLVFDRITR
jgi:hypothetical protein